MYVVSFVNGKGGVGKTTATVNVARALNLRGYRVGVIDTDPAASTLDWISQERKGGDSLSDYIQVRGLTSPVIDKQVKLITDCDFVLIDGAAKADEMTASAIRASDLVVIPVRPSAVDLKQSRDVVDMVHHRQLIDPALKAGFLVSQSDDRTTLASVVRDLLATMDLPMFHTSLAMRADYATSAFYCSSVIEDAPRSKAAREVAALTDEIEAMADGSGRLQVLTDNQE